MNRSHVLYNNVLKVGPNIVNFTIKVIDVNNTPELSIESDHNVVVKINIDENKNDIMTHSERKARRKRIAQEYFMNGSQITEIANKYGVSVGLVKKAIKEFKPTNRSGSSKPTQKSRSNRRRISAKSYEVINDLMNPALLQSQIAEKHKISRQRVHQIKLEAEAIGFNIPHTRVQPAIYYACDICGSKFTGISKSSTCSRKCAKIKNKHNAKKLDNKWSRLVSKEYICKGCGCKFDRTNYLDSITRVNNTTNNRYCSIKCYRNRNKIK